MAAAGAAEKQSSISPRFEWHAEEVAVDAPGGFLAKINRKLLLVILATCSEL